MWLESDRMLSLAFTDKSLEVQRSVVIEEFKQRYINQPYGDIWHILREAAFKVHPYRWPTIGLEISHIEQAVMQDVKDFFFKHYTPANAILCVAGDVVPQQVLDRAEHWFGRVPKRAAYVRNLPQEPAQVSHQMIEVVRDVPQNMLIKAWHCVPRNSPDYPALDLLSDLLSRGKSSRLYRKLVTEQKLFTEIHCYVTGEHDPGLLIVNGMLRPGVSMEEADKAVDAVLLEVTSKPLDAQELEKVKNKYLSSKWFDESTVLSKAMNLCYFELLGDADLANFEADNYRKVSSDDIRRIAEHIFNKSGETTIYYRSKNQTHHE
jgi:predicted Zn-dependent peptidase